MLDLQAVEAQLTGSRLRGPLLYRAQTTSTNDDAMALAASGAGEGTVLIAGHQTAGRGRRQRVWLSNPDHSLLFSIILRPALPAAEFPRLVPLIGIAAAEACAAAGASEVRLKWPNDVLISGRKVAGILVETRVPEFAVAGIGFNVLGSACDLPVELHATATTLAEQVARPDREQLLAAFLNALDTWYCQLLAGQWPQILTRRRELEMTLGQTRTIQTGDTAITGRITDLSPEAGLVIETPTGQRTIEVGEVL